MPSWTWLILSFLGVCLLALIGLAGDGGPGALLTRPDLVPVLYGVLQLFVLEGRVLELAPDRGALQAAAFLAPAVTIYAFLQLVWRDVSSGCSAALYRWVRRRHVIVIGLGAYGRSVAASALMAGERVVAVDLAADRCGRIPERFQRFRFVNADARAIDLAARWGAHRASAILVFSGDDMRNISIARQVCARIGARRAPRHWPRVICHAAATLQRDQAVTDQTHTDPRGPTVEFYSPEEVAARMLIAGDPPEDFARLFRRARVHLAIYGATDLAFEVARQAAVLCQTAGGPGPAISVVAPFGPAAHRRFRDLAGALAGLADIALIDADPAADPAFWQEAFPDLAATVSQHVVCTDDLHLRLDHALRLRRATMALAHANTPIFVGPVGNAGPAGGGRRDRPFASNLIRSFGDAPDVLDWRHVHDQEQDILARQNHETFLRHVRSLDTPPNPLASPAFRPWTRLNESFRHSNRSFADHVPAKARAVGLGVAARGTAVTPDPSAIEALARLEHNRWRAERQAQGWRHASERDDRLRRHPNLVPWDALTEEVRAYDRALVAAIPDLLAKVGKRLVRTCHIGVSGHRDPAADPSNRALVARIEAELAAIEAAHPGHMFRVWSPLAEGSDRLVADLAMRRLSASLTAILPLPIDRYREDFIRVHGADPARRSQQSLDAFQDLLDRADTVFEMPLLEPEETWLGPRAAEIRNRQYASAGAFMVQQCDEMVLVWDGKPPRGFGGTGTVAGWLSGEAMDDDLRWPYPRRSAPPTMRHVSFERD